MGRKRVTKTAKCKRCGSEAVAWEESKKTGKFYLVEVFSFDGVLMADRKEFHSAYCGKPKAHDEEQRELDGEEKETRQRYVGRTSAESAAYFLKLHDLCTSDEAAAREHLNALILELGDEDGLNADRKNQLIAEIRFCFAALGDALEDAETTTAALLD